MPIYCFLYLLKLIYVRRWDHFMIMMISERRKIDSAPMYENVIECEASLCGHGCTDIWNLIDRPNFLFIHPFCPFVRRIGIRKSLLLDSLSWAKILAETKLIWTFFSVVLLIWLFCCWLHNILRYREIRNFVFSLSGCHSLIKIREIDPRLMTDCWNAKITDSMWASSSSIA